jgi:DNA-binding CsgD family transcriptional regulator
MDRTAAFLERRASGSALETADAFVPSLGLRHYAYMMTRLPDGAAIRPEDTLQTNYPQEWAGRYVDRCYRLYDPVVQLGSRSRLPFRWGHGSFLKRFPKLQRRVFHEAKEFGITEGYCVSVAGPDGDVGLFAVCAPTRVEIDDAVEGAASDIEMFAVGVHDQIMRMVRNSRSDIAVTLSPRERECLLWTSAGITTEDIGTRLGLSDSAVNYHLGRASRKLGACNKYHAAILAMQARLL